jgi:hypothetical protein
MGIPVKKEDLEASQRRLVDIIQTLAFGNIEGLRVRDGLPNLDPAPRIVQTIKLDSEPERDTELESSGSTLKKEFEQLFVEMGLLRDAVVSIECRHGLPFRLLIERRPADLIGVDRA